ncbi:unnamed protein product [Parnassius mnemosyne]|uniref:Endonuclease n=1 Tax=Parnassius mnemosyne TaxID=213953 RepID=A0AAV1KIY2_9NEOP
MDNLIFCQEDLSSRIKKADVNFKKSPKERITKEYIESRLEMLEQLWHEFLSGHKELIKIVPSKELTKSTYFKNEIYDNTEEVYLDYKTMLRSNLSAFADHTLGANQSSTDMGLLIGEAERLLKHIPITSDNYERSWALLEDRYNNKRFICHQIIKRLLSQRNILSESANSLKDIIDTTNDCLASLANLGIKTSTWDVLIIYIITLKLDPESRRQWEFYVSNNVPRDDLPNYDQFQEFLTNRYRAIEFLPSDSKSNYKVCHPVKVNSMHATNINCPFCSEEHKLSNCKKFCKESVNARRNFVKNNQVCFCCLGNNHSAKICRYQIKCNVCKRKHHSLLHPVIQPEQNQDSQENTQNLDTKNSSSFVSCISRNKISQHVLLATALVKVLSKTGNLLTIRALLDQGSQSSFVTESTVQMLGLKKTPIKGTISGVGGGNNLISKAMVNLEIRSRIDPNVVIIVKAYVLKSITTLLPATNIESLEWDELPKMTLADPEYYTSNRVDLLLGAEVYSQIIKDGVKKGPYGTPVAQSTTLGWILSGTVNTSRNSSQKIHVMHCQVQDNEMLKKFWELEAEVSIPRLKLLTEEEKQCEKLFAETVQRDEDGRYIVRLPFNTSTPEVGDSLRISEKRLQSLERKFNYNKELKLRYIDVINDYLYLNHMELVKSPDISTKAIYIPHHAVVREDKETTKLRVIFGTACAPYLAVKVLQQVALDDGAEYPLAATRVLQDFYIDDLLTGCHNVEEGVTVYKELRELLSKGGFQLQKWSSNNDELLEKIAEGDRIKGEDAEKGLKLKTDPVLKILGLTWNRNIDSFQYTVTLPTLREPVTKRKIIADIARLFDPLGWIAPTIIQAKIIIQRLWLSGVDWDEEVPNNILNEWITYRKELKLLEKVTISRWLGSKEDATRIELHGFCDASKLAYAAVVYMRVIDSDNNIKVSLLTAKTKVAPIKQVSIPRLELCGGVLLSKLLVEVGDVMRITKENWYAWTDSSVVLAWINSHPNKWKTFVANRVSTILECLEPYQWSHIQSKQNPADCASRGLRPPELLQSFLWQNGPELLKEKIITQNKSKHFETNLEEIKVLMVTIEDEFWSRYSSLNKLLRVIAYCRRFLDLLKPKEERHINRILTKDEINQARETCIKESQRASFTEEIKALKRKERIKRSSKILTLNPFLDAKGILRVGGRLNNSNFTEDKKHPILIPKLGFLARLLIDEAHKNTLHGGAQLMLSYLHSKFWVIGVKPLIKAHIRKCTICVKSAASAQNPLMGQLPSFRVTPERPFKKSGVDYAGPINIRTTKGRGVQSYKGYICLFVCMATKAVHIEAVSDLTSKGFLAAFRRFIARRGHCTDLWSDNGTNFVGASRELQSLFKSEQSYLRKEVTESLASTGTTWHFIPPRAPHFGGLWEAAIKSMKFHLKRIIGDHTLTYEELATVLTQVEACLNSRPLSRIGNLSDDFLTPGHFLVGEPLVTVPDYNYETSSISSLRRWQLTQRMLQGFWRRWSNDYINQLQQRYRWKDQTPEPKEGDVVLVKEDDLPPCKWLLGVIVVKHPGKDNITRVVTLRTKNSLLKRPIAKLCVLPTTK